MKRAVAEDSPTRDLWNTGTQSSHWNWVSDDDFFNGSDIGK